MNADTSTASPRGRSGVSAHRISPSEARRLPRVLAEGVAAALGRNVGGLRALAQRNVLTLDDNTTGHWHLTSTRAGVEAFRLLATQPGNAHLSGLLAFTRANSAGDRLIPPAFALATLAWHYRYTNVTHLDIHHGGDRTQVVEHRAVDGLAQHRATAVLSLDVPRSIPTRDDLAYITAHANRGRSLPEAVLAWMIGSVAPPTRSLLEADTQWHLSVTPRTDHNWFLDPSDPVRVDLDTWTLHRPGDAPTAPAAVTDAARVLDLDLGTGDPDAIYDIPPTMRVKTRCGPSVQELGTHIITLHPDGTHTTEDAAPSTGTPMNPQDLAASHHFLWAMQGVPLDHFCARAVRDLNSISTYAQLDRRGDHLARTLVDLIAVRTLHLARTYIAAGLDLKATGHYLRLGLTANQTLDLARLTTSDARTRLAALVDDLTNGNSVTPRTEADTAIRDLARAVRTNA